MPYDSDVYVPDTKKIIHSLEAAGAGDIPVDEESSQFGFTGKGIDESLLFPVLVDSLKLTKDWSLLNQKLHLDPNYAPKLIKEDGRYNRVQVHDDVKEALQEFRELGLVAPSVSEDLGGSKMPWPISIALKREFAAACKALALEPTLTEDAIEALNKNGSSELIKRFVPKMAQGKASGAMLLTEPNSGSDLSPTKTKATENSEGNYDLQGVKIFATWGEHDASDNIFYMVLAKTDPEAEGTKGLSLFVVPKYKVDENGDLILKDGEPVLNGIECARLHEKFALHGSPTCELTLGVKDKTVGYLVGELNKGMGHMLDMMNPARIGVGSHGAADSWRAIQKALHFANQRKQGPKIGTKDKEQVSIDQHPNIRRMIHESQARAFASQMIADYVAVQLEKAKMSQGEDAERFQRYGDMLTSVAKAGPTDTAVHIVNEMMQVHGGTGYMVESDMPQIVSDARIGPIYEGTNAIQAFNVVFRQLLQIDESPGSRFFEWINEARDDLKNMQGTSDPSKHEFFESIISQLDVFENATKRLLSYAAEGEFETLALVAEDYVTFFDRVLGGYLMARSAHIASLKDNPEMFREFDDMANVYMDYVLLDCLKLDKRINKDSAKTIMSADMQAAYANIGL